MTSRLGLSARAGWRRFDATRLVHGGGRVSMALTARSRARRSFGSRESARRPRLRVEYYGAPPPPHGSSAGGGTPAPDLPPSQAPAGALHSTATEPFVDAAGAPRRLNGFNVTPVWTGHPGDMWPQWRYDQIRDRGFNAVRFVLKWSDFEPARGSFDAYGVGGFDYVPAWARTGDSVTSVQTNGAGYLKLLAARYRREPAVAAYDPVNEFYRWPIDQNGVLRAYDRLIRAIRSVNPHKIVIVQPTYGDTSIAGTLADLSNLTGRRNVVWSIHDYFAGGDDDGYAADGSKSGNYVFGGRTGYPAPNRDQLERHLMVHLTKTRQAGIPMWIGEYGIGDGVENHDQWISDKVALFDKYALGRAWWEYRTTGPMSATAADGSWKPWIDLIAPRIDRAVAAGVTGR